MFDDVIAAPAQRAPDAASITRVGLASAVLVPFAWWYALLREWPDGCRLRGTDLLGLGVAMIALGLAARRPTDDA